MDRFAALIIIQLSLSMISYHLHRQVCHDPGHGRLGQPGAGGGRGPGHSGRGGLPGGVIVVIVIVMFMSLSIVVS